MHIDNKKKDILILDKVPTGGLDDITLTAEKEYFLNFTEQKKGFFKACITMEATVTYLPLVFKYKYKAKHQKINAALLISRKCFQEFFSS